MFDLLDAAEQHDEMEKSGERRAALVKLEGEEACEGLQRFLGAVHTLASDRRLSRYTYFASRFSALDA
jgi:hypothetical protein